MGFSLEIAHGDRTATVKVIGRLTFRTSPELRAALHGLFRSDVESICVDLSACPWMDASGAATLLEGVQWASRKGRRFELCDVGDAVRDMFRLYRLQDVFTTRRTSEAA